MEVITKMWAADQSLTDPLISPIYGDFKGLGKITHFIGTHDMLYPDAIKLDENYQNKEWTSKPLFILKCCMCLLSCQFQKRQML